jgi:hypothetical protein
MMQPQPSDDDLFEGLCMLRELYTRRGTRDREVGLSVDAAVIYGEGLMRIVRRRAEHAARRNPATTD